MNDVAVTERGGGDAEVVIVGGGPAGLAAALALGRARRRVVLCDAGPRRNAAAVHMHNFVTRDGTTPEEFRATAREQLAPYQTVRIKDARVLGVRGASDAFVVDVDGEAISARRLLLTSGMIDERLPIPGFAELWGKSIFQCPYCHGYEVRDQAWGFLVATSHPHVTAFARQLRNFCDRVVVFGAALAPDAVAMLREAGMRVLTSPVRALQGDEALHTVELDDGTKEPCSVLFAHPPQRQVPMVAALGLAVDDDGFVIADAMTKQTSLSGIYAAGDLTSRLQGAIFAAAAGTQAAAMINMDLAMSTSLSG